MRVLDLNQVKLIVDKYGDGYRGVYSKEDMKVHVLDGGGMNVTNIAEIFYNGNFSGLVFKEVQSNLPTEKRTVLEEIAKQIEEATKMKDGLVYVPR